MPSKQLEKFLEKHDKLVKAGTVSEFNRLELLAIQLYDEFLIENKVVK